LKQDSAARSFNPSLEGLRGLAAVLVVVSHCLGVEGFSLGVDLFFVLSGFLITRLIISEFSREGRLSLVRFYVRRAFRLFPALFLFLACVFVWAHAFVPPTGVTTIEGTVLSSLLYVENWHILFAGPTTPGLLIDPATHAWSLSIEEQFYLLWPVVLLAAWRWKGHRGVVVIAGVAMAIALCEWVAVAVAGTTSGRLYFSSDLRAAQLLAGCCVAVVAHGRRLPSLPRGITVGALAAILAIGIEPLQPLLQMGATTLLAALLVAGLAQDEVGILSSTWAVWLGRRSYAIYLWHPLVRAILHYQAHLDDGGLMFMGVLAITFVISDVTYRLLERPLRDVGRRITSTGSVRARRPAAAA
jgi:peptidoglycan/LPS O-acetylase OafA/YrhL